MKTCVFSIKDFETSYIEKANADQHDLKLISESLNENNVELVDDCQAIVTFPNDDLSAGVLDKLKNTKVKFIASRSAGVDHIDIDHARKLNFKLCNAPDYSPHAIAEHTVGMILALNRNFMKAYERIRTHDFRLKGLVGFDLNGKTAGIIGAGKIGAVLTKILYGFGCRILIFDPKKNEELEQKYDAEYTDIDRLCGESDIISIHAPLNEKTKYLINKKKISKMKDGVMIINAGRGKIIKTQDLIEGLKSGKIGKVGLDVYENEKGLFFYDHSEKPLRDEQFAFLEASNNVFITAHQGFTTEEALKNMNEITFKSLTQWEKGEEPENQL